MDLFVVSSSYGEGTIYLLSSDREEKEGGKDTFVPCVWW